VLGLNSRTYDAAQQTWKMAQCVGWNMGGPWAEETRWGHPRGEVHRYAFKEPMAARAYTRATYTNISETHFTWRDEKSDDGKTWS